MLFLLSRVWLQLPAAVLLLSSLRVFMKAEPSNDFQPVFNQEIYIREDKGKDVKRFMNITADPCHNFYEYACGNWLTYHGTPKELQKAVTPKTQLTAKIDSALHNILSLHITIQDSAAERRAKQFYTSCLSAEKNGLKQQNFFSEFVTKNNGFPAVPGSNWLMLYPNYNWLEVVATLRHQYGMDILIGLDIDMNYQNMEENSIYLTEPSTLIPASLCSAEGTQAVDIRDRAYDLVEKEVAENIKGWLTMKLTVAKQLAADIVSFEYDLCTAMRAKSSYENPILRPDYKRHTLMEFTHQYNDSIDFARFVAISFNTPIYKPVFMAAPEYFRQLITTMNEYNITIVANYIMYRALSMLSFPLEDNHSKRTAYCLSLIKQYFPKVLGAMYQNKYSSTNAQEDVESIFEKIKLAFKSSLSSSWLEESTSRLGQRKLNDLNLHLTTYERTPTNIVKTDITNFWQNLVDVMHLKQSQQLVRIFETDLPKPKDEIESYDARIKPRQSHKRIEMGWGLLQAPFYQTQYPTGIRFATIGQTLAKAIAVTFDELHWTADRTGLFNWDPQTQLEYHNRSECFRQQISNYLDNKPNTFHNNTAVRDLIATSGGLNVAFNAYLSWLSLQSPNNNFDNLLKETLTSLNLSNTQLFFVAYAQTHCSAIKRQMNGTSVFGPLMSHNLEYYLVNGPLRNFNEFSREFGCAVGTEMNPADKCVIY